MLFLFVYINRWECSLQKKNYFCVIKKEKEKRKRTISVNPVNAPWGIFQVLTSSTSASPEPVYAVDTRERERVETTITI